MDAQTIKDALEDAARQKIRNYPVYNLSASRLGHPCERYLYLLLKHWDEVKPHDVGLQHIFDLGNSIEDYTIERIKEAGFEVVTPTERSWKININGGVISGREDIRIKDEKGELLPCEIKGLSPFDFDKLNTIEDFFRSKKAHIQGYPSQLFVYMFKFEKEKGFFIITNKLTGEIKPIEVHMDYEFGEKCLQKAERIYKAVADDVAPEACEDMSFCENCPLQHRCGQVKRVPADIETDEELDNLINRKNELRKFCTEYDEVDKQIKDKVGERENVITASYQIIRKASFTKSYTVPERTTYRMNIKKL